MTDFSPEAIEARIQAAIKPQLRRADYLIAMYTMANTFEVSYRAIQQAWDAIRKAFVPAFERIKRTYNIMEDLAVSA